MIHSLRCASSLCSATSVHRECRKTCNQNVIALQTAEHWVIKESDVKRDPATLEFFILNDITLRSRKVIKKKCHASLRIHRHVLCSCCSSVIETIIIRSGMWCLTYGTYSVNPVVSLWSILLFRRPTGSVGVKWSVRFHCLSPEEMMLQKPVTTSAGMKEKDIWKRISRVISVSVAYQEQEWLFLSISCPSHAFQSCHSFSHFLVLRV